MTALTVPAAKKSLAVRHRPRTFATVIGQRHVTAVLRRNVAADSVPQQLLFSGESGLGKTTLARVLAAAMCCENRPAAGDDACGACDACLDIIDASRTHPDVVEFDAASNGLKEQIRDLAARAMTAPIRGRWRIYIIDEAHGLSTGGGQAFLKLLEEPPPHVIFMLATTDPDKMLRTNRGRCVEFEMIRPSDDDLAEHLINVATAENLTLSERVARTIVESTDPALGVRGLLMTLEKLTETLAWGTEPSDEELAALLGVAPASRIDAVTAAVLTGDRAGALDALAALRTSVSDDMIRRALVNWARKHLAATLRDGGAPEAALWRLEQLATAPAGAVWTDLVVTKLASPQLDPSPESLAAQLAEASAVIDQLRAAAAGAREHLDFDDAPRSVVPRDDYTTADSQPHGDEHHPAGADQTGHSAGADPVSDDPELAGRFLDELTSRSRRAAAMVRSATVTAGPGPTIQVLASPGLHQRIVDQRDVCEQAASSLGATLTITQS